MILSGVSFLKDLALGGTAVVQVECAVALMWRSQPQIKCPTGKDFKTAIQ